MVFSDPDFLFFFLPLALGAYYLAPKSWRNVVLLLASWGFYALGSGRLIVLLLLSTATDFVAGLIVGRAKEVGNSRMIRTGVAVSVVVNLALLAYFKYANFFVEQFNSATSSLGFETGSWSAVVLPIGISFYTFQSMSYTIDVSRGRVDPIRKPLDFALYVALFPQLIAGPIVRFHEIAHEVLRRRTRIDDFAEGAIRFAHGLVKKVIIADAVALVADPAFDLDPSDLTTAAAWLGVFAYTIQIYFDFSGYSDMAIGMGRMFGFHFPENFRRPYSAVSVTDFWRRWHVTLSNWFRDYLYFPLGGSRGTTANTYRNLVIVFFLTGLWHGAAWTFVIWGLYHGALLIVERVTDQRPVGDDARNSVLRRSLTLLAVMMGWVIFRADNLAHAWDYLGAMLTWQGGSLPAELAVSMTTRTQIALVIGIAVMFLPRGFVGGIALPRAVGRWPAAGRVGLMLFAFPYALALTAAGTFSPFLYYQF